MPLGRLLPCAFFALVVGVVGCKRDLGECNLDGQTPDGRPIEGPAASLCPSSKQVSDYGDHNHNHNAYAMIARDQR